MDPSCVPGVLVKCQTSTLEGYLKAFFTDNSKFIFGIALIMIIYSGVEYMYSGFSPDRQKAAKQRIVGIITGIAFFFLIGAVMNTLTDAASITILKPS